MMTNDFFMFYFCGKRDFNLRFFCFLKRRTVDNLWLFLFCFFIFLILFIFNSFQSFLLNGIDIGHSFVKKPHMITSCQKLKPH